MVFDFTLENLFCNVQVKFIFTNFNLLYLVPYSGGRLVYTKISQKNLISIRVVSYNLCFTLSCNLLHPYFQCRLIKKITLTTYNNPAPWFKL